MNSFEVYHKRWYLIVYFVMAVGIIVGDIALFFSNYGNFTAFFTALFMKSKNLQELDISILIVLLLIFLIFFSAVTFIFFRRKITVFPDKMVVQKSFSRFECRFGEILKIDILPRNYMTGKSNCLFTVSKDKHTYFSFCENMKNADRLIQILIQQGFIKIQSDGSYVSNRK